VNQFRRTQNHLKEAIERFDCEIPPGLAGLDDPPLRSSRFENRLNRLDSWKEIAVYLDREVRTVQRWEKREHLPVHRHFHHKVGSIFAFKTEIDDWRNGRSLGPDLPVSHKTMPALTVRSPLVLPGASEAKELTALARSPRNLPMAEATAASIPAIIYLNPDAIALALRLDSRQTMNLSAVGIPQSRGRSAL
jgi:hypothetical protein